MMTGVSSAFTTPSQLLSYTDVFAICAFLAFLAIPFTFLFSKSKAGGSPVGEGGHV